MYQTIQPDAPGDSNSPAKWDALRIAADTWSGARLLDIGCNAGYFCERARQSGAAFVTGIDADSGMISHAEQTFADCRFRCQNWNESLPAGPWDVVLFLSAIHYEADPVNLLQRLRRKMASDGLLVLECGIAAGDGERWNLCTRPGSTVRYPTASLMRSILSEAGFSFRWMGQSVDQKGDPTPRHVIHCRPLQRQVLIVGGESGIGKSTLLQSLGNTTYATDDHIRNHSQSPYYQSEWTQLARQCGLSDLRPFYQSVVELPQLASELVDSFVECLPVADCVAVDCFAGLTSLVKESLTRRGFRVWSVDRSTPSGCC